MHTMWLGAEDAFTLPESDCYTRSIAFAPLVLWGQLRPAGDKLIVYDSARSPSVPAQ